MPVSAADLMVTFKADTKDAEAGMQRVNKGITGFAKSAAAVGAGILGAQAFSVITNGFRGATQGALDFGRQMANVNSIAQLSGPAFQELNDQVLALTADPRIAQAPATLAAGLYDIYSSGFQGADGLKVLQQSALAATAGVTDTATAARVVTANLNAFGLSADDAQRVSDVLFQTVNDGVITFDQLANNMGNVIPIANSLGLSVEDVGAAYAQMTLKGVPAAQAETQIAGLMRAALNPTEDLTAAVQAHGYASAAAAIESEGLAGFLDIVTEAAGGNQEEMFNLLGTQEAMNAATILGADHTKAYRKELDRMKAASKGAGATQRALEKQTQSAAFQIDKMKQQVLTLATVGFGILAPAIGKAASVMTRFLSRGVIPFTKAIGQAFKGGFAFNKLLTQLPQPLRRAAHAVGVMAESIGDMIRGGISRNELTQFFHGFQAFVEEASQGVHFVANFVVDAAVKLGELLINGVKAAPGIIFGWVRDKLFGRTGGGSISQDPASPMYGQQGATAPVDVGVIDVAVRLGEIIVNGVAGGVGSLWDWVKGKLLGGLGHGGSISQDPASPMYGQQQTIDLGTIALEIAGVLVHVAAGVAKQAEDQIKAALGTLLVTPDWRMQIAGPSGYDYAGGWDNAQTRADAIEAQLQRAGDAIVHMRWKMLLLAPVLLNPLALVSASIVPLIESQILARVPVINYSFKLAVGFALTLGALGKDLYNRVKALIPDIPDIHQSVDFIVDLVIDVKKTIKTGAEGIWDFLTGHITPLSIGGGPGGGGSPTLPDITQTLNVTAALDISAWTANVNQMKADTDAYDGTQFTAYFGIDLLAALKAYSTAFAMGNAWGNATFTSAFTIDIGPAAVAYTDAFAMGNAWDASVFTASFAIDTSGLWAALAVAQTVAAGIAALMPHSPAREGPLSKPIHFDFIADAARRDLSGMPNQLARYLTANGRIGLRGPGRGGPTITINALRSDELLRLFRNAEAGGSLAHNFHRDLGLSGGA